MGSPPSVRSPSSEIGPHALSRASPARSWPPETTADRLWVACPSSTSLRLLSETVGDPLWVACPPSTSLRLPPEATGDPLWVACSVSRPLWVAASRVGTELDPLWVAIPAGGSERSARPRSTSASADRASGLRALHRGRTVRVHGGRGDGSAAALAAMVPVDGVRLEQRNDPLAGSQRRRA